jgi:hypothetical protein
MNKLRDKTIKSLLVCILALAGLNCVFGKIENKFTLSKVFNAGWGTEPGQIGIFRASSSEGPHSLAVDSKGNIYIADTYNIRVNKYDDKGNFLFSFGTPGLADGQFAEKGYIVGIRNIIADNEENIYVYDSPHNKGRIQKFDKNGNFLFKFSGWKGQEYVRDMWIDSKGNLYLSLIQQPVDFVMKFDSKGRFLYKMEPFTFLGNNDHIYRTKMKSKTEDYKVLIVREYDTNDKFLNEIEIKSKIYSKWIGTDAKGNIYVCVRAKAMWKKGEAEINKYSPNGTLIMTAIMPYKTYPIAESIGMRFLTMNTKGSVYSMTIDWEKGIEIWKLETK